MSGLAIVSVVVGILIVATRGPLVVAPVATLGVYRALLASDSRVRLIGVCVIALGLALALSARGMEGAAAGFLGGFGWVMAVGAVLLLLAFPRFYRELAVSVLDAIEDAAPALGAVGVAFGVLFVYLGLAVV